MKIERTLSAATDLANYTALPLVHVL